MDTNMEIKAALKENGTVADKTLQQMLANIGHPNPQVRDDTIYYGWKSLLENNRLTASQKEKLLDNVLENDLLQFEMDIQNENADGVLTRSFTALLLTELITDH